MTGREIIIEGKLFSTSPEYSTLVAGDPWNSEQNLYLSKKASGFMRIH